jgi:polyhydroxyalkanoate synthesis regulator protein
LFPFGNIEEIGRQNMAMIDRAWSMFTPFKPGSEPGAQNGAPNGAPMDENSALRQEIERLRRELALKDGKKS